MKIAFYGYLAACTQPKWRSQVGNLNFWWSFYSSPTSFFLAYDVYCTNNDNGSYSMFLIISQLMIISEMACMNWKKKSMALRHSIVIFILKNADLTFTKILIVYVTNRICVDCQLWVRRRTYLRLFWFISKTFLKKSFVLIKAVAKKLSQSLKKPKSSKSDSPCRGCNNRSRNNEKDCINDHTNALDACQNNSNKECSGIWGFGPNNKTYRSHYTYSTCIVSKNERNTA